MSLDEQKDWESAYHALKETHEEFQAESKEFEEALEAEITLLQTQEQNARHKTDEVGCWHLLFSPSPFISFRETQI